jgi:hypothetical protein
MVKGEQLSRFDILRTEYIKLLNDKDVLLKWGKPQLEALYSVRIGIFQVQRLQIQLQIQALKRKLEIVRSAIVHNLPIDANAIDLIVAEELAEVENNILQQAIQIEKSRTLLSNLDTPERSAELRKLFKQLAKQLHPDVNPALTDDQTKLWHLAKDAYEHGDVEKLRALQVVYEKELLQAEDLLEKLSENDLYLRMEILSEGIKLLMKEIEEIKLSFPFDIEDKIKDEDWVKTEVDKIETEIKTLRAYEGELILEYQSLTNGYGGIKPELN